MKTGNNLYYFSNPQQCSSMVAACCGGVSIGGRCSIGLIKLNIQFFVL